MNRDLHTYRQDYRWGELLLENAANSPFVQFEQWIEAAKAADIREPNAMTLATVNEQGRPRARIVLLKAFDKNGFVFYTNYDSQKGQDLANHAYGALVFFWDALERQVRIEGQVVQQDKAVSTSYFQSRPRNSQIGAWTSPQSQIIKDRSVLTERQAEIEEQFAGKASLPLPNNWGGYVLVPDTFEFWQGRSSRLHDRIRYRLEQKEWLRERLAP